MPLHALAVSGVADFDIVIAGDETDYVLLDEFPALPTIAKTVVHIRIASGVTIDSSGPTVPAFDLSGLHADSIINIINEASIRGAGGGGGDGARYWNAVWNEKILLGGGGGGAGSAGGAKGVAVSPPLGSETDGTAGSIGSAGTGGLSDDPSGFTADAVSGVNGGQGGTAITTSCLLVITNGSGFILGGGGGGAPGGEDGLGNVDDGQDGGLEGAVGTENAYGNPTAGAAGYAINHTGVAPQWLSGSGSPNVEGLIG